MAIAVSPATPADVPAMVALSAAKRAAYARVVPRFWDPARDADDRQRAWFRSLLARDDVVALVAPGSGGLDGFAIGVVHAAPPVYDPGGPVVTVDDFCVRDPAVWPTVGAALLDALRARARAKGAVLEVVVCGVHDGAKRALVESPGSIPASVWVTRAL
jgi:GNAT superfamily N-acetyltransferase